MNYIFDKECDSMIWGYDYSAQLVVNLVLLIIILSIIFIRRNMEQKRLQDKDETSENKIKN